MPGKNARNESIKLTASWFNGASLTVAGAGIALPMLSRYLGLGAAMSQTGYSWYAVAICIGCTIVLHLLGKYVIGAVVD